MVVSSESDIEVPDLISKLQSSGHIIDVKCEKSSGIMLFFIMPLLISTNNYYFLDPPIQGQVNYDIKFLARHQVGTLIKALSAFIVSTQGTNYNIIIALVIS